MPVSGLQSCLYIDGIPIIDCVCLVLVQAASDFARDKTITEQRRFLPVYEVRQELLQVIRENQVVVVVGETGSGKTTQVLLPLRDAGDKPFGVSAYVQAACTYRG